ncbi:LysR family transcriptional regulator [Amycolatopsis magusensis]|uniref:LysR family transcriptional regulator n=1 Tax=Amycolatopsis magusensis TaxID=882444 RepID=UPI0037B43754
MEAHLRDLRYFTAVAEELSFTKAATERLYISQPALSKQIRQLENLLRVTLFNRDHQRVTLTAAGEALLPRAKQLLGLWDETWRQVAEAAAAKEATLTVGFQTRPGRGLMPRVTAELARLLPGWRLLFRQIAWRDSTAGLARGEVDVAVAWLPVPDSGDLAWRVVASEDRWVALPRDHRLAALEEVPFAELADEPFIALPASAGALRRFWLAVDERETPPRVATEAETAEETFEAVASGLGVVLLAAGNAAIYERDDLVFRPVTGLTPAELAVVWRADDDRRAIKVFVEAFFQCLCAGKP